MGVSGFDKLSFKNWLAKIKSSTFDEKLVCSNSPSHSPKPVKSNLKTAMPQLFKARPIFLTADKFLLQVKQCAKMA